MQYINAVRKRRPCPLWGRRSATAENEMIIESYYQQLQDLCKLYDISLRDAAKKAGVAQTTVYRWEQGTTSPLLAQTRMIEEAIVDGAE